MKNDIYMMNKGTQLNIFFISVLAPLWDHIFTTFHYIWCKFSIINKKMDAGTALSNDGAIWYKFNEEHQHQSIKTSTIFNAQ